MPCAGKPGCIHRIIVSLWLIWYIQCGFSIAHLSIPGTVAHDRCNIFQIFIFFQWCISLSSLLLQLALKKQSRNQKLDS